MGALQIKVKPLRLSKKGTLEKKSVIIRNISVYRKETKWFVILVIENNKGEKENFILIKEKSRLKTNDFMENIRFWKNIDTLFKSIYFLFDDLQDDFFYGFRVFLNDVDVFLLGSE